jgi:hypothetical protein
MLRIGEHKIKRGCRKVEGLGLQLEETVSKWSVSVG